MVVTKKTQQIFVESFFKHEKKIVYDYSFLKNFFLKNHYQLLLARKKIKKSLQLFHPSSRSSAGRLGAAPGSK